jgi:hypothetical protein
MMEKPAVRIFMLLVLLQVGAATAQAAPQQSCAKEVKAIAVVERLSELPADIRDDLIFRFKDMGDRGSPLLQTDAPTALERDLPTSRFAQALLIKNVWFVQFEVAMTGTRTMGYFRGTDGKFTRSPSHYYGGPACETLKAAVNGVTTPGGFNF